MNKYFLLLVALTFQTTSAQADVVVRMNFQYGGGNNNVDVRLFEQSAPLTVANFLKYADGTTINGGSYNDSLIHRSVAGFVVQGGGFNFDTNLNSYPSGIQEITKDNPINNEFNLSNTRGTIAMAKLAGDPNSATNQWFFNLADNSSNLDTANGGFTVFGRLIGSSLSIIDEIGSYPAFDKTGDTTQFGTSFDSLPLVNYTEPNNITSDNLILLKSVSQQFSITENTDFGFTQTGTNSQSVVTIKNTSTGNIVIADIATTDPLATPFSIINDTCSNTMLIVSDSCDITLSFSPLTEGFNKDNFNIQFTTPGINLSYAVSGTGLVDVTAPDISSSHTNLDYGVVPLHDPAIDPFGHYNVIHVYNHGASDLNITSVTFTGGSDFEFYDNCTLATPIAPGAERLMPVYFKPSTLGTVSATLTIASDDPNESSITIPFSGLVDIDSDAIPESIENMAPNNGDGNIDGILDSTQSYVSSLLDINNKYMTLVTENNRYINLINILDANNLSAIPPGLSFPIGAIDLSISNPRTNHSDTLEVGLILPAGVIPNTYYMYGPTNENPSPHWYEFMYDEATGTGAVISGNVTFTSPDDGSQITRSIIKIMLKDGARGDSDLTLNGIFSHQGGPAIDQSKLSGSDDSGSISIYVSTALLINMLLRVKRTR